MICRPRFLVELPKEVVSLQFVFSFDPRRKFQISYYKQFHIIIATHYLRYVHQITFVNNATMTVWYNAEQYYGILFLFQFCILLLPTITIYKKNKALFGYFMLPVNTCHQCFVLSLLRKVINCLTFHSDRHVYKEIIEENQDTISISLSL